MAGPGRKEPLLKVGRKGVLSVVQSVHQEGELAETVCSQLVEMGFFFCPAPHVGGDLCLTASLLRVFLRV